MSLPVDELERMVRATLELLHTLEDEQKQLRADVDRSLSPLAERVTAHAGQLVDVGAELERMRTKQRELEGRLVELQRRQKGDPGEKGEKGERGLRGFPGRDGENAATVIREVKISG